MISLPSIPAAPESRSGAPPFPRPSCLPWRCTWRCVSNALRLAWRFVPKALSSYARVPFFLAIGLLPVRLAGAPVPVLLLLQDLPLSRVALRSGWCPFDRVHAFSSWLAFLSRSLRHTLLRALVSRNVPLLLVFLSRASAFPNTSLALFIPRILSSACASPCFLQMAG